MTNYTITNEAIDEAAEAIRVGIDRRSIWDLAKAAVEAAAPFIRAQALEEAAPLIRDLTDSGECWFDHHGGCQEHGYLSLEPGQTCPQHDAKEFVKAHGVTEGSKP